MIGDIGHIQVLEDFVEVLAIVPSKSKAGGSPNILPQSLISGGEKVIFGSFVLHHKLVGIGALWQCHQHSGRDPEHLDSGSIQQAVISKTENGAQIVNGELRMPLSK